MVLSETASPPPSGAFLQPTTKLSQATATLVAQRSGGLSPQHRSAPGRGLSRPFHPPSPSVSPVVPRPASTTAARVISSKSPRAALLISRQELGSVAAVLQHGRLPRGRRGGSGSKAPLQKPPVQLLQAPSPGVCSHRAPPARCPARRRVGRRCCGSRALNQHRSGRAPRRARDAGHGAGAWRSRPGSLAVVKTTQPPLKNPGAATRAGVSRGSNSHRGGGGGDRFPGP